LYIKEKIKQEEIKLKETQFEQLKLEFDNFKEESSNKSKQLIEEQSLRLKQVKTLERV
jgi:hypothetical protein